MTRNQSQQQNQEEKKLRFNDKVEVRYFNQNDPVKHSTQDNASFKKYKELLAEIISKLYKKNKRILSLKKRVCKIRKKQKNLNSEEIENLQTKIYNLNAKKKKLEQDLKQVMEKLRKSETFFFYF